MKESDLQKQILDYLRLRGIFCWKSNTTGIYDPVRKMFRTNHYKGVADIIGIAQGGFLVAVEVKMKSNKPSPEQVQFINTITTYGGVACIAYSLEDVEKLINGHFGTNNTRLSRQSAA